MKRLTRKIAFLCQFMSVVVAIVVCGAVAIVLQTNFGWNYDGAFHRYGLAIEGGHADDALYWIDRAIVYSSKHSSCGTGDLLEKAFALELGGRYREAEEIFDKVLKHPDANFARLYYKTGQRKRASVEYRNIAIEKGMLNNDYRSFIEHNQFFVEYEILMAKSYLRKLSIFETSDDFIQFMFRYQHESDN